MMALNPRYSVADSIPCMDLPIHKHIYLFILPLVKVFSVRSKYPCTSRWHYSAHSGCCKRIKAFKGSLGPVHRHGVLLSMSALHGRSFIFSKSNGGLGFIPMGMVWPGKYNWLSWSEVVDKMVLMKPFLCYLNPHSLSFCEYLFWLCQVLVAAHEILVASWQTL